MMPNNEANTQALPFGLNELDEKYSQYIKAISSNEEKIKCCVRGCNNHVTRWRRQLKDPAAFCPVHGIRVSTKPTYIYKDWRKNLIIGENEFRNLNKVERWRIGNENSEDALTWNVFYSIKKAGAVERFIEYFFQIKPKCDPILFLWGNQIEDDGTSFWNRLSEIREILEETGAFPTEPDVAILIPNQMIILIEAKFGSPNGTLSGKEERLGGVEEFLEKYISPSDRKDPLLRQNLISLQQNEVLEQLCRNAIFASWISSGSPETTCCLANLVRDNDEKEIEKRISRQVNLNAIDFKRITWEQIYCFVVEQGDRLALLKDYLKNKTYSMKKAFEL